MFVELTREWMGQKAGAVIDLADPDAKILTDGGVAKVVATDPLSPLLTKAMGSMFDGMQKAIDAAVNKALADLQATKALPRSQAAAKLEKEYGSARNKWSGDTQAKLKAALAEGAGVTGGHTVPSQFCDQILAVAAEETTFRQYAGGFSRWRRQPCSSPTST
jgi:hypothetical protein